MSLSVYEERLVYDYIQHILKSALDFFTKSCAHFGQSRGHTVKKYLRLPKKVHFSSHLVQLFEYFVEEESFSDLDDTIPTTDEERKGFYKFEETKMQISKHPSSTDMVIMDTSEPNSSNRSNVVTEPKETQMDIQLEPYNTFVDAITKRTRDMSQDKVKSILNSPDSKKTKTDLLIDDESDDDESVMQSTPEHEEDCVMQSTPEHEEDWDVNDINMVSKTSQSSIRSRVASLFLKLCQNYHDESRKESVCSQSTTHDNSSASCKNYSNIAAVPQMTVPSHVCDKEYTTEVNKGIVWESTPSNAELKNLKNYTDDDSLNQIVPKSCGVSKNSIIADEKRHHENVSNKPLSTAIILAQEITQNNAEKEQGPILIKNETTTHDFKDKASYETFLHDSKPTNHPILVLDSCTKCEENPSSRNGTLEEIRTLLMPIGDEPKPHPFDTRPNIVLNPELICESNLTVCYKPESLRNASSETTTIKLPVNNSPVCSSKNYVDFKFSKAAFEDTSESVEDTIKNVDTLHYQSAATTPISSYFDSEQSMSLPTAAQVPVQPVDDMLSELMASQAVRSFSESSSTTFNNFVRPISARKRKLIFERMDNAFAVPDIDELPVYDREETYLEIMNDIIKEETTSEDVKMAVDENYSIRDDDKYTPKIYKPTTPSKECPSFSWNPLKKNDDSVVPFSHAPFINIHNEFLTPQKVRLGLSKKIKARNRLHPYKK